MESTETPLNTMLISKINSINDVNTLNDLSLELTNYISTLSDVRNQEGGARQKKARIPKMNRNPQKININNAPEIQGLYKNQKHRAVQEVLFGPTKYCMIEGEKIEKHFSSKFSKTPVCKISELPQSLWDVNDPNKFKHHDNKLTSAFKTTEVRSKLLSKIRCDISNSRSVGLDRLRFSQLLKIDKNCELLTAFYNACLRVNSVPKNWNETYSVLVKINENEDDNPDDLKNWKSITMYNTIPKLFYALLAARLYVWGINSEKISSTQRSYKLDNAACESSFLLQECKNYVNLTGKNLVVSWLNFADAAESIPQSAVLYVLQKFAVPEVILNIIKTAFNESETMIRVSSYESKSYTGFTEPIKIVNGMLPGNPLNPVLLSLVMEPLLKSLLIAKNDTIQIYKENINHFVMCNELTLFTDSVAKMNNLLTLVNERAKLIGIKFKNDKSSILHYCGKNNQVITTESFVFNNQKLRILSEDEMDKFFGVKQALRIAEDVIPTLDEMKKNIELINESKLDSYQKIDSVNKFIYPRVENYFKGLQEIPDLQSEDEMLKLVAKKWLDLPDKVSDEVIILPAEEGGAGFYPLKDLINIMKIVHAFKMFTSEYETVKLIAFNSLKYEVSLVLRIPVEKISTDQMTDYLSGNIKLKKNLILNPSTWQITRKATVNLKEKINVSWKYNKNLEEMQLKLKRNNRSIILRGNYRSNVIKKLKDELVFFYTNELNKSNPGYKSEITIPDLKKKRSNKRKYSKRTGRRSKRTTKKVVKNQENNAGAQQVPLVTQNLSVQ